MNEKTGKRLVVCVNERFGLNQKSCGGSGSRDLIVALRQQLAQRKLGYVVDEQVCFGRCAQGIVLRIAPGGPFFSKVTQQNIPAILDALEQFEAPH